MDAQAEYPLPPTLVLEQEASEQGAPRVPKAQEKRPHEARPAPVPELDEDAESPPLCLTELAPDRPERRSAQRRKQDRRAGSAKESPTALGREEVRRLVAERPELIEAGLRVHTDGEHGPVGIGFSTAVGEIDLLARDNAGSWVVVAVAQPGGAPGHGKELVSDLLQRMGWVRKHLGAKGQEVRGMVLLDSVPEDLGYAAAAVADTVEFKRYRLALSFESVDVV